MNRPLLIAAFGLVIAALAIGLNYQSMLTEEPQPASVASEKATPEPAAQPAIIRPDPPTFDVVRVNPQGDAVFAGRATPGSTVVILDGVHEIGRIVADSRGEWVFVPDKPLEPGRRRLKLEMIIGDADPVASDDQVVLVVPERNKNIAGQPGNGESLAFKISPDGTTTVLQKPGGNGGLKLTVDAVDYDEDGQLAISGKAEPDAMIQLYLDNRFIGHARTEADSGNGTGPWSVKPEVKVKPGLYTLRADHVDNAGKVLARVEFPFSRAENTTDLTDKDVIIVQPGNSLWRLARSTYGCGVQYTVIFEANKDQIKNPDLIYPGQVFKMPASQ